LEDNIENSNNIIKLHEKTDNFNPIEENMKDEYEFCNKYIDKDEEHKNNMNPGNTKLDRYKDIKPNKNNTIEINKNIESKNHYINASGINHKYFIATQGPKNQKTVEDFWTMIDEQNSKVIVMLCKKIEGGKKNVQITGMTKKKLENLRIMKLQLQKKKKDRKRNI
jgi:protein tyrosine phosphatase